MHSQFPTKMQFRKNQIRYLLHCHWNGDVGQRLEKQVFMFSLNRVDSCFYLFESVLAFIVRFGFYFSVQQYCHIWYSFALQIHYFSFYIELLNLYDHLNINWFSGNMNFKLLRWDFYLFVSQSGLNEQ
jgi:hypothetical protein